jgi:hypothetical protein
MHKVYFVIVAERGMEPRARSGGEKCFAWLMGLGIGVL